MSLSQGFSLARRRPSVRILRVVLRLTIGAIILALLWGAFVGVLWLVGSSRIEGVPLSSLRDDVLMLGASGARAPEESTTILVLLVEPLDPTVLRPTPLAAPPIILQLGGDREVPAALVLPESIEVLVDGRGLMRLDEIQRELGADRLARAVIDYTEVRLDHVVALSTEALRASSACSGHSRCAVAGVVTSPPRTTCVHGSATPIPRWCSPGARQCCARSRATSTSRCSSARHCSAERS